MTPTITIGTLVRDREWILPYFLEHVKSINYNKSKITLLFILNNSKDKSKEILENFRNQNKQFYNKIIIKEKNFKDQPEDTRDIFVGERNKKFKVLDRRDNFKFLAELRNYLLSLVETDYLFSLDSDILINNKDILYRLLEHKKDIVSAIICNGFINQSKDPFNWYNTGYFINNRWKSLTQSIVKRMIRNNEKLFQCDVTGAIYLLSKEVCKNSNIKYVDSKYGEDLGFCINAKRQGYKLYSDVTLYENHIMSKEYLEKFLNNTIDKPNFL